MFYQQPQNVVWAEEFFCGIGIKVVTGKIYLGGSIMKSEAENIWMDRKVEGWAEYVETLAGVSRKHLQSAYAGMQKSLQQE